MQCTHNQLKSLRWTFMDWMTKRTSFVSPLVVSWCATHALHNLRQMGTIDRPQSCSWHPVLCDQAGFAYIRAEDDSDQLSDRNTQKHSTMAPPCDRGPVCQKVPWSALHQLSESTPVVTCNGAFSSIIPSEQCSSSDIVATAQQEGTGGELEKGGKERTGLSQEL